MTRTAKAVLAFVQKKMTNKNTYYKEGNKMNAARPTHNRKICMQTFNSEGLPFVTFDFETSGLNIFLDRPVQISAIKCQIKDGYVVYQKNKNSKKSLYNLQNNTIIENTYDDIRIMDKDNLYSPNSKHQPVCIRKNRDYP